MVCLVPCWPVPKSSNDPRDPYSHAVVRYLEGGVSYGQGTPVLASSQGRADEDDSCQRHVRQPGKGNSKSHGARPVHLIISMIKWIQTTVLARRRPVPASNDTCNWIQFGPVSGFPALSKFSSRPYSNLVTALCKSSSLSAPAIYKFSAVLAGAEELQRPARSVLARRHPIPTHSMEFN